MKRRSLASRRERPLIGVTTSEVRRAESTEPTPEGEPPRHEMALGLPYLPITPTFPLLGPAGLLPLPSKWRVRFGQPIELGRVHGPEAAKDRILVARLTDQIRSGLQEILGDLAVGGPASGEA